MEESYKDFKVRQTTRKGCRGKVYNSFGVYDVYKYIRKNKWYDIGRPLKEHEFYSIIRTMNRKIAEKIAMGESFKFPERMGLIELRKYATGVKLVDNKPKISYPVDWEETLKLWYEDEEAKKKKVLLRNENPFVYFIKYDKFNANYENKCFYRFDLNSFIKEKLSKNIKQGKIDTLW